MRLVCTAWAAALAVLALAAPARAASGMEVGIEDERLLLTDPARVSQVVADWAATGIDTVRLHARWNAIAPRADALRRPRGFRPRDPASPGYDWTALDRAVGEILAHGMTPMLTVTGGAPLWATRHPRVRRPQAEPRPAMFADFAAAVARRYGRFVDRYLIWNEPNQPGWLLPQQSCRGHGRARQCDQVAAHLYRRLFRVASREIRRYDGGARIFLGELAPVGRRSRSSQAPTAPLPFLRALACVDRRYRPVRTGRCRHFHAPSADAFGYHPHGKVQPPDRPNPDRDEAQIADLGRLFAVLDRLTAMRRLRAPVRTHRKFDVYLTEFAFQTRPPDPADGISLALQARYVQQAAYLAWKRPRVRNLTHYQWEDELMFRRPGTHNRYGGWQAGLRFYDGRPKPVMRVFPAPFVVDSAGRRFWGQVRPGGAHRVTLWRQRPGAGTWRRIAVARTDARGYWTRRGRPERSARYRFTWQDPGAPAASASGVVRVRATGPSVQAAAAR